MKISKALRTKNLIVKKIIRLQRILTSENSYPEERPPIHNLKEVFSEMKLNIDKLVELKSKIAVKNSEISDILSRQDEIKSMITFLNGIPTKSGKYTMDDYSSDPKMVNYKAEFSQLEIEGMIKELEDEFNSNQDTLNEFNYSQEIDFVE